MNHGAVQIVGWVLVAFSTLLVGIVIGIAVQVRRRGVTPEALLPIGLICFGSLLGAINIAVGYPDSWFGYGLIAAQLAVTGLALFLLWPVLKRRIRGG